MNENQNHSNLCRTCLATEQNDLISVFNIIEVEAINVAISDMLMDCASIQVLPSDILPTNICDSCVALAKQSYLFKQICQKSEKYLLNTIEIPIKQDSIEPKLLIADNALKYCQESVQNTNEEYVDKLANKNIESSVSVSENLRSKTKKTSRKISVNVRHTRELRSHQTKKENYTCDQCSMRFDNTTVLMEHKRKHSEEKVFECKHCNKEFNQNHDLNMHELLHTLDKSCESHQHRKTISKQPWLTSYLKSHEIRKSQTTNRTDRTRIPENHYECSLCDKSFTHQAHLASHINTHAQINSDEKDQSVSFLDRDLCTHTSKMPYSCSQCDKSFEQKRGLAAHLRKHTVRKSHKCHECWRLFSKKSNLIKHLLIHTHKCNQCSEVFKEKQDLDTHILCTHARSEKTISSDTEMQKDYVNPCDIIEIDEDELDSQIHEEDDQVITNVKNEIPNCNENELVSALQIYQSLQEVIDIKEEYNIIDVKEEPKSEYDCI